VGKLLLSLYRWKLSKLENATRAKNPSARPEAITRAAKKGFRSWLALFAVEVLSYCIAFPMISYYGGLEIARLLQFDWWAVSLYSLLTGVMWTHGLIIFVVGVDAYFIARAAYFVAIYCAYRAGRNT
jgi:hypothetical protein